MTTTMVRERAPASARLDLRVARRSREALVFGGAVAISLVHALDDAFLHREPGVGLGQHAFAAALALVLGLAAVAAFPSARPALRSALALFLGAPRRSTARSTSSTSRTRARRAVTSPARSPPRPASR